MQHQMVRKANYLIEATYKLSAVEQKIILFLASTLKHDDVDFKPYHFKIKTFQNFMNTVDANYAWLEQTILSLKEKNLRIVYKNENNKKVVLNVNWLSSSKYIEGTGVVELRFDPNLRPFLLQLKSRFTNYRLENVVQLKSQFSIRLYELLKQYEIIGKRLFGLCDLRSLLGIEEGQYQQYTDFRKRVIVTAQTELAEKTDIRFTFKEKRVTRKVDAITFHIKQNQLNPKNEFQNTTNPAVVAKISKLESLYDLLPKPYSNKISIKKEIAKSLEKNNFDYVMRNILYSNANSNALKPGANKGKSSNYRAYLAKALQNDYGLAYMEDQQSQKEAEQQRQKAFVEVRQQKQREINQINQERENRNKARVFMKSCTLETMQQLEEKARCRLSSDALERYNNKHYIGIFEFKRKLEDIVMEHTGIIKAVAKPQKTVEVA